MLIKEARKKGPKSDEARPCQTNHTPFEVSGSTSLVWELFFRSAINARRDLAMGSADTEAVEGYVLIRHPR